MPANTLHLDMMIQSIKEVKEGQETLYEIICSGDGKNNPLLTRVFILEESYLELKKELHNIEYAQSQKRSEDRKAKWQIIILFISAMLGWITAIISHISWSAFGRWLSTM